MEASDNEARSVMPWDVSDEGILVVPEEVTLIEAGAFACSRMIRRADLGNVRHVGARAFQDCPNLSSVVMKHVETIDPMAFEFCRSLRSIVIGDVAEIGERAFFSCVNLDIPRIPRSVSSVGQGAFSHTAIREADLGWLRDIPPYLFSCCTSLTRADISSAETIGEEAFAGCTALSEVRFDAAEIIGSKAFERCDSFCVMHLPDGLRELGEGAFSSIRSGLSVPPGISKIGRNCFGPVSRAKSIRIYRSSLYELRNYFGHDQAAAEYGEEHFYLWESAIDVTVIDDITGEITGFLPLYSDLDPALRHALISAFRPDNTFDYSILDTVIFDGMSWNRRCMDRQAVMRAKHPFCLSDAAGKKYRDYLRRHLDRIAGSAVRDRDIDMLAFLCDSGLIDRDNITAMIDHAVAIAAPECTGFLLERQKELGWMGSSVLDEL